MIKRILMRVRRECTEMRLGVKQGMIKGNPNYFQAIDSRLDAVLILTKRDRGDLQNEHFGDK